MTEGEGGQSKEKCGGYTEAIEIHYLTLSSIDLQTYVDSL